MNTKLSKFAIVAMAALALLGCKEENPLLGEWKLIKTAELNATAFQLAKVSGNAQIRFEEDRVISGEFATEVSYSVSGDEVTVRYSNGETNTYLIENGDHFTFEVPKAGVFRYKRMR